MAKHTMDMSKEKAMTELFNDGEQKLKILSMEEGTSKAGNSQFLTEIMCLSNGATGIFYLVAVEGKRWLLKSLLEATGAYEKDGDNNYTFDTDDIIGKVVGGQVVNVDEEYYDNYGEKKIIKKSKIKKFFAIEEQTTESSSVANDDEIPF